MCNNCKDFNDSLDDIFGATEHKEVTDVSLVPVIPAAIKYKEVCSACKGTGKFYSYSGRYVGPCFKCKGKSEITFKTSPEARAKARDAFVARKERSIEDNLADFAAREPAIAAWYTGSTFGFAIAMRDAVAKFGDLTERQLAAAHNCVAKLAAAKQASADRITNAPTVDCSIVQTALDTAKGNGLKNPKLRVAGFTFSLAKANSANFGSVYVKSGDTYAGKVKGGKFYAAKGIDAAMITAIVAAAASPRDAAIAHGKLTGNCSCCGRTLTDPVSVANGIGPICAEKFGW